MLNLLLSTLALTRAAAAAGYQWPSPQYDALEDFLYEGGRPDGSSLGALVSPCRLRGATNTTVAAEWVRLVYHDAATHQIADGSGGLDGSIFFETDRTENNGAGMNNTLNDFSVYPSKYVSRADVIVLGTVMAVATCGGPAIPIQGGRIDANVAGPYGVPNITDSLDSLKGTFAHQGFNVSEMIQLVACGHTLGGVRYPDFPNVVPGSGSQTVVQLFDDTQRFDHSIISQYLDGSTRDPLIVANASAASDLLVFSADNNVTMQSMNSEQAFSSTCSTIFQKMFRTVPSTVNLTDNIDLVPVKVTGVQLTIGSPELQFQANVRLQLSSNHTTVTMYWCDRYGSGANCASKLKRFTAPSTSAPVSSPFSATMNLTLQKYQFVVPLAANQSISKFWFEIDYGNGTTTVANNNGAFYNIDQDAVLFVPSQSRPKAVLSGSNGVFIAAAVKSTNTPSRVYVDWIGRATKNFIAVNGTTDLKLNSSIPSVAGYNFYTAEITEEYGASMQFDVISVQQNGTSLADTYKWDTLIGLNTPAETQVNSTTSSAAGGASGAVAVATAGPWTWSVAAAALAVLSAAL
ncbi:unnamed protein product [Mycena citricolor]|uniref:Peroxidase n=1 Tax=Mycena citricolor TaxID=2018698 RepID=A0AAD2Q3S1_9AGAR|nr:unnamed protein product [Mycena citricolor]